MFKKIPLLLLLLISTHYNLHAQYNLAHEIGITFGPVAFQSDYGERHDIETNAGNTGFGIVSLIDKKKNFFKIKLTIDKTNQTITKSQVFDKSGTIHTYTVTNQVPNIKLEDGFFVFDEKKYPKCEVIDLR